MIKYIYTALTCLLLFVLTGSAQSDPIKFTFLSARDGLLSNSVNAILKDHYGLMWFATDDGLNKFDGTNFTVYRHTPGDSSSLRANEILALHEDRAGNLWIGTSGGGLSKYDRKRDAFIHYPLQSQTQELPGNAVIMSICSDLSGKVWIAQFEYLFVFDPANNTLSRLKLQAAADANHSPASPVCVFADSKQRIWAGTINGLYLYTGGSNLFKKYVHNDKDSFSLVGNKIRAITEDSKGFIWVGTSAGLCRLRPDGAGFNSLRQLNGNTSRLNSHEINCIEPDAGGHLWIGTSEGLNILNTQSLTVSTYLPEENNIHSLTSKYIRCAYIDRQGIYWLGTFRGGINKYDKNLNLFDLKLSSTFREQGCNTTIVSSFAENSNGLIYFGTDGGGMYEFNRTTSRIKPVDWKLPVKYSGKMSILVLLQSRENKLYIGSYGQGLMVVDPATGMGKQFVQGPGPDNLSGNDIFCIKEDRKGNIWVGTNGQGVNVLKNNKVIARYTPCLHPA
ncbi:ligand-binding sensor domain-containing protein [Paraflavitalea speifideaquila]|uniref:ligand-binding sensor domain-containing protein n=1 Tax=Paraflavitalea speifideaquila TaxID=3076558 RepID=UPI0028EEB098|nr:two-component regulator propeller domain-containing protein [Paraflavitalea speifideiaquila]